MSTRHVETARITIGALASPITEQLKEFNLSDDKIARILPFDFDANAIIRLHIRGIITDAEYNNVSKRLVKKIIQILNEIN